MENYCSKVCTEKELSFGGLIAEAAGNCLFYIPVDTFPENPVVAVVRPNPGKEGLKAFSDYLKSEYNSAYFDRKRALEHVAHSTFKNPQVIPVLNAVGLHDMIGKRTGTNIFSSVLFFPSQNRPTPKQLKDSVYFTYLVRCPVEHAGSFDPCALPELQKCAQQRLLYDLERFPDLKLVLWLGDGKVESFVKENILPKLADKKVESLFLPDSNSEEIRKFLENAENTRKRLEEILLK